MDSRSSRLNLRALSQHTGSSVTAHRVTVSHNMGDTRKYKDPEGTGGRVAGATVPLATRLARGRSIKFKTREQSNWEYARRIQRWHARDARRRGKPVPQPYLFTPAERKDRRRGRE